MIQPPSMLFIVEIAPIDTKHRAWPVDTFDRLDDVDVF